MKTKKEWLDRLQPRYAEAVENMFVGYADAGLLSAREVLDNIVAWEGGIATGFQICCLVQEVFGVELPKEVQW